MSQSIEDYLKGIYVLNTEKKYSNKDIAEYLKVSPASVSEMIKKFVNDGYVYMDGKSIKLTLEGQRKAKKILRIHRVWEVFLVETLGYDIDEIHDEAEKLEHVTSDKLLHKLEKFLFYPKVCPHGSPIFYDQDSFENEQIKKLSDIEVGETIAILSVEENIELYDYLNLVGIKIKEKYKVLRKDPFNGPIYLVSDENKEKIIAYDATKHIIVYVINEK